MMVTDIVRTSAGSEDAWKQLVEQYAPRVFGWCRRAGLQPADADDVVQQVFSTKGILNLRLDRPGDTFSGWLFVVTKNKILNHFAQGAAAPAQLGNFEASSRMPSSSYQIVRGKRVPCPRAVMTYSELADVIVASLVSAGRALSLPGRRRKKAIAKCVGLALWNIGKIMVPVDDLLEETISQLRLDVQIARYLRTLLAPTALMGNDLPAELVYLRRHPIWPAFKGEFKNSLEKRLFS